MDGEGAVVDLRDYRDPIALDELWSPPPPARDSEIEDLTMKVLDHLRSEGGRPLRVPDPEEELRARISIRQPGPLPPEVQEALDRLLGAERESKGVVRGAEVPRVSERVALWRGDITRLQVDAVTNAANAALLGCFQPFHPCIDNSLHWQAGPRMRADCDTIMRLQGGQEPTGRAKITRGYNLPARFVLHTVGPIVTGALTQLQREELASSYSSCLSLAKRVGIRSLAFCAISTGVYGFPNAPAAEVAVTTVSGWMRENSSAIDLVVFDVFTDKDEEAYIRALNAT